MTRRESGTGSIRYLPERDRWQASLLVTGTDGRPHRRSKFTTTRKEATAALAQLQREAQRGSTDPRTLPTLREHLDRWLEDVVTPSVRPGTLRTYRYHVGYLADELGHLRVDRLTPHAVQQNYRQALTQFAAKTVNARGTVLRRALVFAVRWYGIASPFADGAVEAPRLPHRQGRTLSGPESVRLVQSAVEAGDRLAALWDVLLCAGLRISEALGLRWGDVDMDTGLVTLAGQLAREGGVWLIAPTKTEHRHRPVVLLDETVALLRAVRVRQAEERLRAGRAWDQPVPDLIFTRPTGLPLYAGTVRVAFTRALARAFPHNTPVITPHGLRHSAATQAGRYGAPLKSVSSVLGHADIGITANLYQNVGIEEAVAFREAIRRSREG